MKNYVISLITAKERRAHIIKEFGKQGVDFEFFDAITPEQVPSLAKTFHINIENSPLTQGELACLFSHVCLWQKAIDDNLDYITIFEDDIYLGENANIFLNDSEHLKNTGADYPKTKTFLQKIKQSDNLIHLSDNRYSKVLHKSHLSTVSYIISQKPPSRFLTS
ncbi:glycosyltransferase family 25 protein [Moraxella sp. VT-16-12]|uniref:glycosyltransferase family 25 protein n=1 Tax=Moraxella sp. VT-16-12 TaxID=2014877 RepID=UPI000B7D1476|nr:glycosyltransferase family 25 protein [Moraxella sp. VT-16-12]TWV83507.1 glycosyltransferase family 25 protein [Moraxella sp. VT-16-12]